MRTVLKLLISITKFIWKKMGVPGVLFLVILFVVPIGVAMFEDASDDYVYENQWEIRSVYIEQTEKSQDKTVQFSNYDLDEEYGKKYIYQVEAMVANVGVNPINIDRDFGLIYVENENGYMENAQVWEYYYEMDQYYRLDTSVIASGRTMPVKFLFVFEEDDIPSKLYFYDSYEGEELFSVDVPAPK